MLPALVPIIIPANGVNPIEVSIDFPPLTAAKEQPFPKWHVTIFKSLISFPITSATLFETYLCDVPWNPYFLTPYFSYNSYGNGQI